MKRKPKSICCYSFLFLSYSSSSFHFVFFSSSFYFEFSTRCVMMIFIKEYHTHAHAQLVHHVVHATHLQNVAFLKREAAILTRRLPLLFLMYCLLFIHFLLNVQMYTFIVVHTAFKANANHIPHLIRHRVVVCNKECILYQMVAFMATAVCFNFDMLSIFIPFRK